MKMKKMVYAVPLMAMLAGCGQVNSDEVGFKTWFGKIDTPTLEPGLYFVCPFAGKLWYYTIRDIRRDIKMETYTKDIQTAEFNISVIHTIDPSKLTELHTKYGPNYAEVLIDPAVAAATKDVIGQWEADKLVNGREQAAKSIYDKVVSLLDNKPVRIKAVVLSNCDFSDIFERAIEAKVVAMQEAIKAKNKTVQIEEEAKQRLILAESEAKAMTIKGNALKANPGLVSLEAVQKWDGKAPQTLVVGNDMKTMLPLK
jgi:prohibitin 2